MIDQTPGICAYSKNIFFLTLSILIIFVSFTATANSTSLTIPDISPWTARDTNPAGTAWQHARSFYLKYEILPSPGVLAPVRTEALLGYTETALWFRFFSYDPHPNSIRIHYRRHDQISSTGDDYVGIMLSPFNDTQWAYEFFCSAGSTEADYLIQRGVEYSSYDAVWFCDARRTDYGYEVTIEIPFRSLNLPLTNDPQTWRILLIRNRASNSFRYLLTDAPYDSNISCLLCQAEMVATQTPINSRHTNVQVIPATIVERKDVASSSGQSGLVTGAPKVSGGLDVRWQLRPDLEWSGTLNPNFSEVAPDILQPTFNRRFPVFYPENRPFFRQGTYVFDTPLKLVDTRQIDDPHWATKLVGQIRSNSVGALLADDSITNILLPGPETSDLQSFDFSTRDGLFRYRRDLDGNSSFGFLATSRLGGGYSNSVVAADGGWQISPSDALAFVSAYSETNYPSDVAKALNISPGYYQGNAWQFNYDRERTHYSATLQLAQISNAFRADLGFIPQVGYLEAMPQFFFRWYGSEKSWYKRWGLGSYLDWYQELGGGPIIFRQTQAYIFAHLVGQSYLEFDAQRSDVFVKGKTFQLEQKILKATTQPYAWLNSGLQLTVGDGIDYIGALRGKILTISQTVSLAIGVHLQVDFAGSFEDFNVEAGRVYTENLYDLRASWHFSPHEFVRIIGQEQDVRRNVSFYPPGTNSRTRTLATQLLFGYEITPWTALYAGFSNEYLSSGSVGLIPQGRIFYLKMSYDFQG